MLDHGGVRILKQLDILRYFSRMHQPHIEISPPKYVKIYIQKAKQTLITQPGGWRRRSGRILFITV